MNAAKFMAHVVSLMGHGEPGVVTRILTRV